MSWHDSSSSSPRHSRRCWSRQARLQRSKSRTSWSSSRRSRRPSPILRSPSSPSTRRKNGTSRVKTSALAAGTPGRLRADRRMEGPAAGRHLLGRRERALRQARRAEAARAARSAEGGRGRDPDRASASRSRFRSRIRKASGSARCSSPTASSITRGCSQRLGVARAEGLGRPAQSEAEGQRRAVRADALVEQSRDLRSDPAARRRRQGLGVAQASRRQHRHLHRAQP